MICFQLTVLGLIIGASFFLSIELPSLVSCLQAIAQQARACSLGRDGL